MPKSIRWIGWALALALIALGLLARPASAEINPWAMSVAESAASPSAATPRAGRGRLARLHDAGHALQWRDRTHLPAPAGILRGIAQAIVTGLTANTQTNIEFSTGTLIRPQLELGSAFGGLIERGLDAELPYCQRYFQRLPWRGMSVSVPLATRLTLTRSLPAQMRANPTASLVTTSAPAAAAQVAGVDTSAATVAILASYPDKSGISVTINGYAGLTPGQSGFGASAANFIDLDAEI